MSIWIQLESKLTSSSPQFFTLNPSRRRPPLAFPSFQKDIRQMAQVASQKDTTALLELLRSPSWQTFLTIAEEQGERALSSFLHLY